MILHLNLDPNIAIPEFKQDVEKQAQHKKIWVNEHWAPNNVVESSFAGWFSQVHHPDACDQQRLHNTLNCDIQQVFNNNHKYYMEWIQQFPELQNWNGHNEFPHVTICTVKSHWKQNGNKTWNTQEIGVFGPRKFRSLVKQLLIEAGLLQNRGITTFVDAAIPFAGKATNTEYGKALSKHQQFLRSQDV